MASGRLGGFWEFVRDLQGWLVALVWAIATLAGLAGFLEQGLAAGTPYSLAGAFYLTLQLFVLESGSLEGPIPPLLELARWLAPLVAGFTAVKAVALLFSEELALLRLRRYNNHIVICGLGRKGLLWARAFLKDGLRVVIIERDEANDRIEAARHAGAIVLHGDATEPELLRKARVARARYILAVCGPAGSNAEIALRCRELVPKNSGPRATCFAHISDPLLYELLREQSYNTTSESGLRIEYFNLFEAGARVLLSQTRPLPMDLPTRPALVIVGFGQFGQSLLSQLALEWQALASEGAPKPFVTLIDRYATERLTTLVTRLPLVSEVLELTTLDFSLESADFHRAEFLTTQPGVKLTSVFICLDDEPLAVSAALRLEPKLPESDAPIIVRLEEENGLAALLRVSTPDHKAYRLQVFGLLERACTPEQLLSSGHELLARALHEQYVAEALKLGDTPETNSSLVPWSQLPERLQDSNRTQADALGQLLAEAGLGIRALTRLDAGQYRLDEATLEQVAQKEHSRWRKEREAAGWKYAPGLKDSRHKTHPDLLDWGELQETTREKNRAAIRGLPRLLGTVGLELCRSGAPNCECAQKES